jgi:hypothetical protein
MKKMNSVENGIFLVANATTTNTCIMSFITHWIVHLASELQDCFCSYDGATPKQPLSGHVVPSPTCFLVTHSNDERELFTLLCDAGMPPLP